MAKSEVRPNDKLSEHFRLIPAQTSALRRLRIETVRDLLYHFPARYENIAAIRAVENVHKDEDAVLYGRITKLDTRKTWKSRRPIAEGYLEDGTGSIKVMWFNQPYIAKMLTEGANVKLAGRITGTEGKLYLANPEIERLESLPIDVHDSLFEKSDEETLFAIYPESRGITSRWFRHAIERLLSNGVLDALEDPIPADTRERFNLPGLKTALIWIHTPRREKDTIAARKRFSFEEIFTIQLARQQMRRQVDTEHAYTIKPDAEDIDEFTSRFPFALTTAQNRAIEAILEDFSSTHPMSRLLEGDVGSGKTAVAATVAYATVISTPPGRAHGHLQVAYMAPTEILAKQHFESFIEYFKHLPIEVGLITSSGSQKFPSKINPESPTDISRSQLLKWVKEGKVTILVGTHALIQEKVSFGHLALVVIDEQHRFGTFQRQKLTKKNPKEFQSLPHLLSMTATPIPRTLALTLYGDLDLTLLDEMPAGRKPIITEIVTPTKRKETYEKVRTELKAGRQAYVICPRIDEPDPEKQYATQAKSVKEECARLKKEVFQEFEIAPLHGQMKPDEKDDIMRRFAAHDIDILVATSVVEVGVNVPNATVIIIEGAERFGLAQLHQLRGRVIRSTEQAYCFVFSETRSKHTLDRLRALQTAKNGFELAEHDLALRGPGELYGRSQSGLSDVGMEALKNLKLVEHSRAEAQKFIEKDPELRDYPTLASLVEHKRKTLHFE
jgi:ATP-dependent DNA helicase RecG